MIVRQNLHLICAPSSRPTYSMGVNTIKTALKVELHKIFEFLFSSLVPIAFVELIYIRILLITKVSLQIFIFFEKQFNFITLITRQLVVKSVSIVKILCYFVWFAKRVFTLIAKIEYRILILFIKLYYLPLVIRMYN